MKNITITPHAILSLLISITLLINTTTPALAQVQKRTPRFELTLPQQDYINRQVQTVPNDAIPATSNAHIPLLVANENFYKGKLTDEQLARLKQIQWMFTPSLEGLEPKSDFEQFQPLYTQEIDKEFDLQHKKMKDSMAHMGQQIKKTAANYRKEIYEDLVRQVTNRVLATQENPDHSHADTLSKRILNDITLSAYNPQQDLNTQLISLSQKYNNNPQAVQILQEIATTTQQDEKYLSGEQAVMQWADQANAQLKDWYQTNFSSLTQWKKQNYAKAQQVFDEEYNPQLLQAREEEVHKAIRDLWAYKDLAPKASQQFLTLAPIILPLRTLDGKSFLNKEQKNWLYTQYTQALEKGITCGTNDEKGDACQFAFLSMTGLSMLSDAHPAAVSIVKFMEAKLKTPYSALALLNGAAALLSMKQYDVLGGFLYKATREEHNIDDIDILSFETLVNLIANMNGQYLGEVSKYAQYPTQDNPTDQTALANAWEDMAQLLANEGSPEALALLRQYGVEKCYMVTETSITLHEKQKLVCAGIIPLLAGALTSGKSGAEKYNLKGTNTTPGSYLNHHGQAGYISVQQAQQNARIQAANNQAFYNYAASMGLSNAAMVARHLFLQSMGDLNAESELRLDNNLYQAYYATHPAPKPGFAISNYTRNSPEYNAKRERQDRTRFWRKAAHIGDIAFLVWCIYDISKWARSGVKIASAMSKAATMARNGATVAERAMMLRRLNIAPKLRNVTTLGARIKSRMSPAVLSELPHFTTNTVQLPKFEGFVESAGKLVAQNMRFSAETGVLAADIPALTDAAHGVYSAEQLNAFNGLLKTAAVNANTQFANRSALSRFFTFNKNASYRSYLNRNLLKLKPTPGMTEADLHTLALQTSRLKISVPQNIAAFKAPSFLEKSNGISQLNATALTQKLTKLFGVTLSPEYVTRAEKLLSTAITNANTQFLNRSWLARQWGFLRGTNNKKYKNILLNNIAAEFDKDGKMFGDATLFKIHQEVTDWVKADQTLSAPAWSSQFFHLGSSAQSGKFHTMGSTLLLQKDAMPLAFPVAVQMQLKRAFHKGIKGVDSRTYQRVLISEKDGKLLFGFGTDLASPLKPSQFKLILDETEIPFLLRATQSYTGPALEIKLTAPSGSFFSKRWTAFKQAGQEGHWNPFPTLFRGKNNIYVHEIPVSLRQADGTLARLPLTFQADSYLGLRGANAVLEEGGKLAWYRGENLLQTPKLTYSLPKKQIRPFLQVLRTSGLQQPLHITALPSKNKITPLMWATGLSLSSASTGLIAPLENIYGNNITETDKTLISLAFPYLPSLAAPLFSPLVMKIGALRTLQLALGISTAGLAFATFNGFPGIMDKNNLPPIWPLFVSGTAIGISSALSRAGLNLLIDSMGGKSSLLKSMAFKNIGSLALLLPPFVFNFVNKDIDFSLAFPVLGTLSAGSLLWVSSSRINTELGKMAGFMPLKPFSTFRPATWKNLGSNWLTIGKGAYEETRNTFRLLRTREVLPLVLAATAFTGFEAGSFNKATNQMMNNMWRPHVNSMVENGYMPESNRKNTTNILANLAVICFPLFTRLASNPLTEALKTQRAGDEFRRILLGSFTLNGIGAYLLYNNGLGSSPSLLDNILSPGMLGVAMIGVGTANMTQSFQKLSNITILQSKYAKMLTKGLSKEAKATVEDALKTKTMTGFPMQQLGLAIVPTIVSGYTDRQIAEGTIQKSEAPQSSLWIPITSLALCFSLAAPSILDFVPSRIPTGVLGLSKGIFGSYSNAFKQLFQQPSYLPQPLNKMQNGLSSPLLRPAMNMSPFTPTQNPLENKLEYELTAPQPTPAADQPATQEPVQE